MSQLFVNEITPVAPATSVRIDGLALSGASFNGRPIFDVTHPDYGAKGDGITDDRAAIQAALTKAQVAGASGGVVFFPPLKYNLGSWNPSGATGAFTYNLTYGTFSYATNPIVLYGPGATLTTSLTNPLGAGNGSGMLFVSGGLTRPVIRGLTFENTAITANRGGYSVAINIGGGSNNSIVQMEVLENRFRNFSRGIMANGVQGLWITRNRWEYDNGRDSANTNLADPCVGIWCFVNANGQASDVHIEDNDWDGCLAASVAGNINRLSADGLVYGAARGWTIRGNRIKHNAFEAMYLGSRQSFESTRFPTIIQGNTIDGTFPTGMPQAGNGNYGIRSDEHDTSVIGNAVNNCCSGVRFYGFGLGAPIERPVVKDNTMLMPGSTQNTDSAIYIGNCNHADVQDNSAHWITSASTADLPGINVTNSSRVVLKNNWLRLIGKPAGQASSGIKVALSTKVLLDGNWVDGFDSLLNNTDTSDVQFLANHEIDGGNWVTGTMTNVVGPELVSSDRGDASVTVVSRVDATRQRFDTTLTANRTFTASVSGAIQGDRFRITRTGLGAFTLSVQDSLSNVLKVMPSATAAFVEIGFTGTAWKLEAYGTL